MESKRLERMALKELKRLEREEKIARRNQEAGVSSEAPPDGAGEDEAISELSGQSACAGMPPVELFPTCALRPGCSDGNITFLAKPMKPRNSEFNMKEPQQKLKGFAQADQQEW